MLTNGSGTLAIDSGVVDIAGGVWTVGTVTGTGGLKIAGGLVTLAGNNNFSGGIALAPARSSSRRRPHSETRLLPSCQARLPRW